MQKVRVEMAAMKRDAEHYSRQVRSTVSESVSSPLMEFPSYPSIPIKLLGYFIGLATFF